MNFKSPGWQAVAIGLSVINLAAVGFAAMTAEPLHAAVHGALALAFGLWAQRLRHPPAENEHKRDARLEVLEAEVSDLQRELNATQEGLSFAEQLLAQRQEARRVEQQRVEPDRVEQQRVDAPRDEPEKPV